MSRISVLKTYKIYIGGQFPRTESGRYYTLKNNHAEVIANVCLSSRKDFRNAVVSARTAFNSWSIKTAFNRSQILYRIAEMLEGRKTQFIAELVLQGLAAKQAAAEVEQSIDRIIYFAGWCDKYQQISSTVNPVSSSHFNFSVPEPTGVVAIIAPEKNSLLALVTLIASCIAGGNACIVLSSESMPLCSITFAEVINSSDVPAGVVNILTGSSKELHSVISSHIDVNAVIYAKQNTSELKTIQTNAAINVKRVFDYGTYNWSNASAENPYLILNLQEIKTTWHPIENIGIGGAKY
ncbi:MAG: aldehyde dehydrogenase family protein [Bacteroidia bacterium]|nr:aldehyde dehydrogenase family protein [Bacteroidia bacterium]